MNSDKYSNTGYDDNSAFRFSNNTFDRLVRVRLLDFAMLPPKSKCWIYFKKVDKVNAECKICTQGVKYCGNTSNLSKHLKKHPNVLEPGTSGSTRKTCKQLKLDVTPYCKFVTCLKQTSNIVLSTTIVQDPESETEECVDDPNLKRPIIDSFNRISSYAEGGFNHRKITMYLLYFICKDYRPFAVVEGEGFKRLFKELAPSYKIPSVTTLKNALDNKYEATKELLKGCLLAAPHVCITLDSWTETMNEKSFLGVTVHYLKDISIKSHCLAVAELKERHSAQYISEILDKILSDWQIDKSKIFTVVTDDGANVVAAVNKTFGKSRHTPCFAHTINLVATHTVGQKNMKPIISKVREIVKWVKNSVIHSDQLRKKQSKAGFLRENLKN
ncbi:E3 SUMO-protein ligase ZBED1-like [Daktulosphaira vitifoliae]|uniref:E3 SUMO-protein ligase ZBED1-like n=1 Tax=Daktulosphaira vitifoliae TaxID=58002 RepID=UPI0021AA61CF|nr:E3 SUMO-protein ligase ZBED1-like [Daktulosphaira vitifoliae]